MRILFNKTLILWEKFYNLKIVDDSTANLNDLWNFGSMALICLFLIIIVLWNSFLEKTIYIYCLYYKNGFYKNFKIKELNQKKFCSSNLKKIEVLVQFRKEVLKLDLNEELNKFNKEIDKDFIIKYEKYWKNFYGYIVLFEYIASDNDNEKKEEKFGIVFFNLLNIEMEYLEYIDHDHINCFINNDYNIIYSRLASEEEYNTIMFILGIFFKDNSKITVIEWKEIFLEIFDDIIKNKIFFEYIDENIPIKYYDFYNLNDLINCLYYSFDEN